MSKQDKRRRAYKNAGELFYYLLELVHVKQMRVIISMRRNRRGFRFTFDQKCCSYVYTEYVEYDLLKRKLRETHFRVIAKRIFLNGFE